MVCAVCSLHAHCPCILCAAAAAAAAGLASWHPVNAKGCMLTYSIAAFCAALLHRARAGPSTRRERHAAGPQPGEGRRQPPQTHQPCNLPLLPASKSSSRTCKQPHLNPSCSSASATGQGGSSSHPTIQDYQQDCWLLLGKGLFRMAGTCSSRCIGGASLYRSCKL
jgi:hypothetical protein